MAPDRRYTVFAHECDEMSVRDEIASRSHVVGDGSEGGPERAPFAGNPHVARSEQGVDVRDRLVTGERPGEDARMGDDPEVADDSRPEEVRESWTGGKVLDERMGPIVKRASGVRRVDEDVGIDGLAHRNWGSGAEPAVEHGGHRLLVLEVHPRLEIAGHPRERWRFLLVGGERLGD